MGFFLLASVIVLLVAEFSVMSWAMDTVGALDAVALLLAVSLVGAWLTKRAGLGAAQRIRETVAEGRTPSRELVDGALILLAGVLLVVPGFVTGAVGVLLLLPPVRAAVRSVLQRRLGSGRGAVIVRGRTGTTGRAAVWDVESWEGSHRSSRDGGRRTGSTELGGPQ